MMIGSLVIGHDRRRPQEFKYNANDRVHSQHGTLRIATSTWLERQRRMADLAVTTTECRRTELSVMVSKPERPRLADLHRFDKGVARKWRISSQAIVWFRVSSPPKPRTNARLHLGGALVSMGQH